MSTGMPWRARLRAMTSAPCAPPRTSAEGGRSLIAASSAQVRRGLGRPRKHLFGARLRPGIGRSRAVGADVARDGTRRIAGAPDEAQQRAKTAHRGRADEMQAAHARLVA